MLLHSLSRQCGFLSCRLLNVMDSLADFAIFVRLFRPSVRLSITFLPCLPSSFALKCFNFLIIVNKILLVASTLCFVNLLLLLYRFPYKIYLIYLYLNEFCSSVFFFCALCSSSNYVRKYLRKYR